MHGLSLIVTSVAFGMGVVSLMVGVTSLMRRRVVIPWLRQRIGWQQYGWSQVLLSAFVLLETGPRLGNVSSVALLTISMIAVVPLVAGIVAMMRAPQPGP